MFDIELRIASLDQEQREASKKTIHELVHHLTSELKTEDLDSIIYTDTFKEDITSFQRSKNVQEGYTESSFGSAIAKVISYEEGHQQKHTVFLNSVLYWALCDENYKNLAIHTLHHELGHVHDDSIRFQSYKPFQITRTDDIMTIASKIGEIMWMEFIADRVAITSFTESSGLRDDDVRDLALAIVEKMDNTINEFFMEGNSYTVFIKIQEETNLLLNITGNLLGRIHGLQIREYLDRLRMEYYTPFLVRFSEELEHLYNTYPNFHGMSDFLPLARVIVDLWEVLGVSFDADHEGINITISKPSVLTSS
ncbi:hypothetical protein ASD24_24360 [Paenibacillus sp. Root52]|uniref:hypothetical protein n=1 Tax=Paenibacillus sp. Root52 TaxID=1736552 RepID=UPI0006F5FFB7|nr:hypothetical protein [Paenibacillus sp. Root52]KQY90934.1 hypothetical protein ASD24_24360 [Paenibacillus sp. Root52]